MPNEGQGRERTWWERNYGDAWSQESRDAHARAKSNLMASQSGPIAHLSPAKPIPGENPLDKYQWAANQQPGQGRRPRRPQPNLEYWANLFANMTN